MRVVGKGKEKAGDEAQKRMKVEDRTIGVRSPVV